MKTLEVYFVIANGLRYIKGFLYEEWAQDYAKEWNSDPDNANDPVHVETYHVLQEPKKYMNFEKWRKL